MAEKTPRFKPPVTAEVQFGRSLRKIARHAGHIVGVHIDGTKILDEPGMQRALRDYSKLIEPWARRQAAKMLEKVSKANKRAYNHQSKEIGRNLKKVVLNTPIGEEAFRLMHEQVQLITSLPIRAGERAQALAAEAVVEGRRASEIAEELAATAEVSEAQAMCIARTEVARSTASLNQARAKAAGSRQYRWRNSGDASVREAHKSYKGTRLDGRIFDWDNPPTLDDGTTGNPGTFPNCRCFGEPLFPEE